MRKQLRDRFFLLAKLVAFLFLVTISSLNSAEARNRIDEEKKYQVMATMITKFLIYIEWPELLKTEDDKDLIELCIMGENPFGKTTPKGVIRKMSSLFDSGVFPGIQGGPLEHVIASKAVAFGEALTKEYKNYMKQVKTNADVMAQAFVDKGYNVISGGTDNHLMLIDLRNKFPDITGRKVEKPHSQRDCRDRYARY